MWEEYSCSEDDGDSEDDLAELEARLYSQYHYQEEPTIESPEMKEPESQIKVNKINSEPTYISLSDGKDGKKSSNSIKKLSNGTIKKEPSDGTVKKEPSNGSLTVKKEPSNGSLTVKKEPLGDRHKKKEGGALIKANPFYSSSDDSSEDEGIIAITPDSLKRDSDISVTNITISDDDEEPSRSRSRSESNKKLAQPPPVNKKRKRKDFYVADFGSDFSDNFVSGGSSSGDSESDVIEGGNDSDDECMEVDESTDMKFNMKVDDSTDMKFNISTPRSQSQERTLEIMEVDRKPAVVPRKWSLDMNIFYSKIEEQNISITTEDMVKESPEDRWHLDLSDRYSNKKQNNRYFLTKARCRNCNEFGHMMRDCPDPVKEIRCSMCGIQGHREDRCPRSCCLGCGNPDHMFRSICHHCKLMERVMCKECGYYGHKKQSCPDLWRRYHSTTEYNNNKENLPCPRNTESHKRRPDQWCCNCGRRGHLVEDCRRMRYSEYPVRPVTVKRYEAVKRLVQIVQENETEISSSSKKSKKNKKSFSSSQSPPPKRRKVVKNPASDHFNHSSTSEKVFNKPNKSYKKPKERDSGHLNSSIMEQFYRSNKNLKNQPQSPLTPKQLKKLFKKANKSFPNQFASNKSSKPHRRKGKIDVQEDKLSKKQRRKENRKGEEMMVQKRFKDQSPQYEFKRRGKVQEIKPGKKNKKESYGNNQKHFNHLNSFKSKKKNKNEKF